MIFSLVVPLWDFGEMCVAVDLCERSDHWPIFVGEGNAVRSDCAGTTRLGQRLGKEGSLLAIALTGGCWQVSVKGESAF